MWQKYSETLAQKKQLEKFLQTLKKPKENQKDAFPFVCRSLNEKISRRNYFPATSYCYGKKYLRERRFKKTTLHFSSIETRVKNLAQRINHAKEQLDALKIQLTNILKAIQRRSGEGNVHPM